MRNTNSSLVLLAVIYKEILGFHASRMSVNSNIKDIKENINDASISIKVDYKTTMKLRSDYGIFEHDIARSFNDNLTEYMRKIYDLEGKLKRYIQDDVTELNEIKVDLIKVIKEKILLQEKTTAAVSKIATIEQIIGYVPDTNDNQYEDMEQKQEFIIDNEEEQYE